MQLDPALLINTLRFKAAGHRATLSNSLIAEALDDFADAVKKSTIRPNDNDSDDSAK
jgi:hypothetical protein